MFPLKSDLRKHCKPPSSLASTLSHCLQLLHEHVSLSRRAGLRLGLLLASCICLLPVPFIKFLCKSFIDSCVQYVQLTEKQQHILNVVYF